MACARQGSGDELRAICAFVCTVVELLSDSAVNARLSDTKAMSEVRALDSFYQMLQLDANRAVYG